MIGIFVHVLGSLHSTDSGAISESLSEMDLSNDIPYEEHDEVENEVEAETTSRSSQEEMFEPASPSSPDSDLPQLTPTMSNKHSAAENSCICEAHQEKRIKSS